MMRNLDIDSVIRALKSCPDVCIESDTCTVDIETIYKITDELRSDEPDLETVHGMVEDMRSNIDELVSDLQEFDDALSDVERLCSEEYEGIDED